jgi:uncharacterized protein (TIGR02453 family)
VGFEGFGEYAIDFFDDLTVDNSKSFWDEHKHIYASDVRAPMEALLAELEPEFSDFGAAKVFRPYRDVRFAKDKTPYKTHCGGVIERARGAGAYYVQISPEGLLVAGGCFHADAAQLRAFRVAVDDERRGAELAALLAKLRKGGWEITGDVMKTAPRGFAKDHERIELLKHRSLYARKLYEPDDALHEKQTLRRVRTGWRAVRALNEWMADHVGLPEETESRR